MTTAFFTSAGPFVPANLWAPANILASVDSPAPANLILSPHAGLLVLQDITKLLFIEKLVKVVDNTTAQIYTKSIIWIDGVPFASLDEV